MSNRSTPRAEEIYKHFKGKLYQVITIARHTEREEELVIYRALYGTFKTYARPLSMFLSEVDKEKYPEVSAKYRFIKVVPASSIKPRPPEAKADSEPTPPKENPVSIPTPLPVSAERTESDEARAMALFMEFLDETSFDKKRNILRAITPIATNSIINSMAASLDLVPSGVSRDADLKMIGDYISARIHFDGSRLRQS